MFWCSRLPVGIEIHCAIHLNQKRTKHGPRLRSITVNFWTNSWLATCLECILGIKNCPRSSAFEGEASLEGEASRHFPAVNPHISSIFQIVHLSSGQYCQKLLPDRLAHIISIIYTTFSRFLPHKTKQSLASTMSARSELASTPSTASTPHRSPCMFTVEHFLQAASSQDTNKDLIQSYIVRPSAIWESLERFKQFKRTDATVPSALTPSTDMQ